MMGGGGSKHFYGDCLQNNVKGQIEMTEDCQLSFCIIHDPVSQMWSGFIQPRNSNVFPTHLSFIACFSSPHKESLQRQLILNGRALFKTLNLIQKFKITSNFIISSIYKTNEMKLSWPRRGTYDIFHILSSSIV